MRMSRLLSHTRREAPSESDQISFQLLVRAGFIQPLPAGNYGLLPLGERTLQNLMTLVRRELDTLEAQEVSLPLVQPAELWQDYPLSAARVGEQSSGEMVIAPNDLPAVLEMVRAQLKSYRQLPMLLYHKAAFWRGSEPGRVGLLRGRQAQVVEMFSMHASSQELETFYGRVNNTFERIFAECTLPVRRAVGNPAGGTAAHEWLCLIDGGDKNIVYCPACGYAATQEAADFYRLPSPPEEPLPLEKVATPHSATIEALANCLQIPTARTAKAVFLIAHRSRSGLSQEKELVFVVVRGDRMVNETALMNILGVDELRPAEIDDIAAVGAAAGYASPIGLKGVRVIVDEQIPLSPNLVSGANEDGYHFLNVNYGRDYEASQVAKIALAQAGDLCPLCHASPMESAEGYVLAQTKQHGLDFTARRGVTFMGEDGQVQPGLIASYRLELTRLLACLAEAHHDEYGLRWPAPIAPFPIHLVVLNGRKSDEPQRAGKEIAALLAAEGFEPLVDDRSDSPGVKFMDADLIGLPLRLTIGERSLQQGGVEIKLRRHSDAETVSLDQVVSRVRDLLGREGLPV